MISTTQYLASSSGRTWWTQQFYHYSYISSDGEICQPALV